MDVKQYLEAYRRCPFYSKEPYEGQEKDKSIIREYNKELIRKYPWLEPTNRFSGKKITDCASGEDGYWPGAPNEHPEYDYEFTELDEMPDGWRLAFGEQVCDELQKELEKFNYVDEFVILQIKEKFGSLKIYTGPTPIGTIAEEPMEIVQKSEWDWSWKNGNPKYENTHVTWDKNENGYIFKVYKILDKCRITDIIDKYENLSEKICIMCGKPAKWMTMGWISPYCDNCKKELESKIYDEFTSIEKEK